MVTVLSPRALNRALLERQRLLQRVRVAPLDLVEHLVGMHSQVPIDPYVAMWSRVDGFDPEELGRLVTEHTAVRLTLMRGTLHLASARDALTLQPLLHGVYERQVRSVFRRELEGLDLEAFAAAGRELFAAEPRGSLAVGRLLAERFPGRDPAALGIAVRAFLPLVQLPPRGVWGKTRAAVFGPLEPFLGRGVDAAPSIDAVVLRYLAAFGPASVADVQSWCGLTRLREVTDRLAPRLRTFADEQGRVLFDVPDGVLPDPGTPAPVRFLPQYDNVLFGHDDRARVVPPHAWAMSNTDIWLGSLLLDGFRCGTWRILVEGRRCAVLQVEPLTRWSAAQRDAVLAEGLLLTRFLHPRVHERGAQVIESFA